MDKNDPSYNSINTYDYSFTFLNNNDDGKTEKMNSNDEIENQMSKRTKMLSIIKIYYFYPIKTIIIILFPVVISYKIIKKEILSPDLDNYLDKVYGEKDLLKIIKRDEIEMTDCSKRRKYDIKK